MKRNQKSAFSIFGLCTAFAISGLTNPVWSHSGAADYLGNTSFRIKDDSYAPYTQKISIKTTDFKETYKKLIENGYDVAGVDVDENIIDILMTDFTSPEFQSWKGVFVISDKEITGKKLDDDYHNYEEISEKLQEISKKFPEITNLISIGKSVNERDIWAIKISDQAATRESNEPVVLYNSVHHAREIATAEVALDTILHLTENYGIDDAITNWVDNTEIWVVPVVNPDGHMKVYKSNPFWRKNTRNGHGVDLNRNYPGSWDSCSGSSGFPFSDTYRGPEPASEPETKALMALVETIKPSFDISYHSYSELVLYPYGCADDHTETKNVVEPIGKKMAELFVRDSGTGTYKPGTPWEILYSADGSDMDWMYMEQQVIPFVIELGSRSGGFHPSYQMAQDIVKRARPSWKYLLDRASASSAYIALQGEFEFEKLKVVAKLLNGKPGEDGVSQIHQFRNDGTTQIILRPGMYQIVLLDNEDKEVQKTETIIGEELVNIQFDLGE